MRNVEALFKIAGKGNVSTQTGIRARILELLEEEGRKTTREISDELDLGRKQVTDAITGLKKGKLVESEKDGNTWYHKLADKDKNHESMEKVGEKWGGKDNDTYREYVQKFLCVLVAKGKMDDEEMIEYARWLAKQAMLSNIHADAEGIK